MKSDLLFKILSVFVIPLLAWGIKLEVSNAVQNEQITQLQADADATKPLSVMMGRVEEKIDATNKRLDEIKADLRRSLPPSP